MRRLIVSFALTAVLGGGLTLATTGRADAALTKCTGLITTTVAGNLIVPSGAFCQLDKMTVNGSVAVLPGAHLQFFPGVTIEGSLTASKALVDCSPGFVPRPPDVIRGPVSSSRGTFIVCPGTQYGSDVTISRAIVSSPFALNPTGVHVAGNFTFTRSVDKAGNIAGWAIDGSVIITKNGPGAFDFSNSTVGGLVKCTLNAPTITGTEVEANNLGGPNGNGLYGQCAGLDPV